MRLIDADALIEKCKDIVFKYPNGHEYRHRCVDPDVIREMPTIEERKTGKWIRVHGFATPGGDPVWCCSECGKGVHVYGIEHGTYGADISDGQWKACPNCSTLMEGEQA